MKKGEEKGLFDVERGYEIIWDNKGYPYIVDNEKVIITKERVSVKCFKLDDFERFMADERVGDSHKLIGLCTGHKFDNKGHNWLVLNEYMSLPYSYMTFVIKNKIEEKDPE